jgi:APA family basic amino acid/polyamine antiporter
LLLLISGLFLPAKYVTQATTHPADIPPLSWIRSLGVALVSVSFVYGGYQQTINFGNDVRNPVRNVPRGIFAGIALIIVLYLLVNGSYYNIVGFNQMKNDRAIAHTAIGNLFGNQAAQVFSGFLFIGVLAYVNALLLSNPRVMYAMGSEGSLPRIFARQNTRNNVLTFSLTVFAALCLIVLAFSQEFEKILNFSIFLDCFGMVASSATLFKLRRQTGHLDGTGIYKMKLYPLLPLLFIAAYLFIGASIAIEQPRIALTGILVLGGFIGLYFLLQVRRKRQ